MAKTNWQLNDTVLPSDMNQIGQEINDLQDDYVRQPAFATTAGTAGAYTITLNPAPTIISDGFGVTIVPHIANTANPTLNINELGAIALKDQKGVGYTAGKLQAGKPYMFRKVGADFLADSSGGSGDAVAGDIRAGKTATTDNGEVTGTLPVRTGGTVTPSAVNQTKQAGVYDTDIVVLGSANLIAENIKKDIIVFGIVGTYDKPFVYENIRTNTIIPPNSSIVYTPTSISQIDAWELYASNSGVNYNILAVWMGSGFRFRDSNFNFSSSSPSSTRNVIQLFNRDTVPLTITGSIKGT